MDQRPNAVDSVTNPILLGQTTGVVAFAVTLHLRFLLHLRGLHLTGPHFGQGLPLFVWHLTRQAPASAAAALAADAIPPGARVFVSVAQLGPTRLELDGIVASPTDPVAMINRRLLGVGEGLDGWVVEKIEAKQVTLRGGRETIVLRLR